MFVTLAFLRATLGAAVTTPCLQLSFNPFPISALILRKTKNALAVVAGGKRQRRTNICDILTDIAFVKRRNHIKPNEMFICAGLVGKFKTEGRN